MYFTPEHLHFLSQLAPPDPAWGSTGAIPLSPDIRDHDVRSLPGVSEVLEAGVPDSVDLTHLIQGEILNQGATGACVAYSSSHVAAMDDVIETGQWANIQAAEVYRRAGGQGSNGVDSRLVLSQAVEQGMPLVGGGAVKTIASYAFVPQQPGVFTQAIKAALAAGYPLVVAMLLPTDFAQTFKSGHGSVSSGYHQLACCGYTADGYWLFLNSWGPGFQPPGSPRPGLCAVLQSFCEANSLQQNYCFSYVVTGIPTPKPDPKPDPSPSPDSLTLSAKASGAGLSTLAVGQRISGLSQQGFQGALEITQINGGPTPKPKPDPKPDPSPNPGGLVLQIPTKRYSASMIGVWCYVSDQTGKPVAANLTATINGATMEARNGVSTAVWILRGTQAAGPLTINIDAQAPNGQTGHGSATIK